MFCSHFFFGWISRSRSYPNRGDESFACWSLCVILIDLVEVSWVLFPFFFGLILNLVLVWMICMLALSSLWLIMGLDLRPSWSLENGRNRLWVVSLLVIYQKIWSLHHGVSWCSLSVNAFLVVDLWTEIVLSPGSWSIGFLIAWAILYRRSRKPEVLALDDILALSRSKGLSWSQRALLFIVL